mgnify:FL=1
MEINENISPTVVAAELAAHERECAVRYSTMEKQLDSLVGRIKRLESMIMLSTLSSIIAVITIFWTVLNA